MRKSRSVRFHRIILCLFALAIVLGGGFAFWRNASGARFASALAAAQAGKKLAYRVELETTLSGKADRLSHLKIEGTWQLEPGKDKGRGWVLTHLSGARLSSDTAPEDQQEAMQGAAARLSEPVAFALDERGAIRDVRESRNLPRELANMLKSLGAMNQLVDNQRGEITWTAAENDVPGEYEARYARQSSTLLGKRKTHYTKVLGSSDASLNRTSLLKVAESHYDFVFGADGVLESLTAREVVRARGQYVDGLTTTTRLSMKRVQSADAEEPRELPHGLVISDLHRSPNYGGPSLSADAYHVGGRTFEELFDALEALPLYRERTDEEKREGRFAFRAMAAKLRVDDESVEDALAEIEDNSPVSRQLWVALGSAGTPAAQKALREIIDMPQWAIHERRSQMIALAMVSQPTRETVDFLRSKFDDQEQGDAARLGVGTTVNRLKDYQPDEAERAFQMLVDELRRATDPGTKAVMLRALGNTGYPAAFDVVVTYLRDPQIEVRAGATMGLRLIPGEAADDALMGVLAEDPSEFVRLTSINAISGREPSPINLTALVEAADTDSSEEVRGAAAKALGQFEAESQAVAEAVAKYRETRAKGT